ncbi:SGNH/GDSL hydrolase family protein, partial [Octadecabacter sp.]|nr:SGNH/GDSL hydrolase family protein [Octadecabacter sp.]
MSTLTRRARQWPHCTGCAFYPVLVTQGPFIKFRTPRLQEPKGARMGVIGQGPDLRLLIVGDSSAAGGGVATQSQ